jgi:hypothetical protein
MQKHRYLNIVRFLGLLTMPTVMLMLLACDNGGKHSGYVYNSNGLYGGGGGLGIYQNRGPQIDGPAFGNPGVFGSHGFAGNGFFPSGSCITRSPHYFQNGFGSSLGVSGARNYNHSFGPVRPPFVNSYNCPIYVQTSSCNAIVSQSHYEAANYLQQAMQNLQTGNFTEGYRLIGEAERANPNDERFAGYLDEFKASTEDMLANRDVVKMYEAKQHEGFYHSVPDEGEILTDLGNISESLGGYLRWAVFNRIHNITHPLSTWARSLETAEEYNRVNAYGFNSWNSWENHWSGVANGQH